MPWGHQCRWAGLVSGRRHAAPDVRAGGGIVAGLGVAKAGPLRSGGAAQVISFEEFYGAGEPVDPAAVIKRYDAATHEALADGYRGLRVSADVTALVRAPEQQDAFAQCEFLLERYSSRHPLSAMCGYRHELGDAGTPV